jgi:hypothetical protein
MAGPPPVPQPPTSYGQPASGKDHRDTAQITVSSMSWQITLAGVADFGPAASSSNAKSISHYYSPERRHIQGEPAPRITR